MRIKISYVHSSIPKSNRYGCGILPIFMKKEKRETPICPICGQSLSFMMSSGRILYCDKCEKYFKNDNGKVGEECKSPYTNPNALY